MSDNKTTTTSGISFATLLFLLFLTLKLSGIGEVATWSWVWVTSPLWIPIALIGLFIIFVMIMKAIFD